MRGEYTFGFEAIEFAEELPPRARRIPHSQWGDVSKLGTTSACAENTRLRFVVFGRRRNYLRVRGEYKSRLWLVAGRMELPPRARRIHLVDRLERAEGGTTSACAENTGISDSSMSWHRNYLRVRGEYVASGYTESTPWELPPRARRIHV